mmetsp:Transcript_22637/g.63604  ORF Transcript_22637/g.63604 Transcript_22637/m.63604 type:complete len:463 (-) Transcript_22637:48-1436(-)
MGTEKDKGIDAEVQRVMDLISQQEMYAWVSPKNLEKVAGICHREIFGEGNYLLRQGEESDRAYFVMNGEVRRLRTTIGSDQEHVVDRKSIGMAVNSLHHLGRDKVYASAVCTSPRCEAFCLLGGELEELLRKEPDLAREVIQSLQIEVRRQNKSLRAYKTPMLETKQRFVNVPACMIAAGTESYYRSALNAYLNYSLTGERGRLFPNMGVQVPTRIMYVLGFKSLRSMADIYVDARQYQNPTSVRLASVLAPGIIMCPVSSILEATNAGNLNPESMATRWMRGYLPRMMREVIFGVGLNQLSDVLEERLMGMHVVNKYVSNILGSLGAGIVAGYLSHVPHNLSTLKLVEPKTPYSSLFQKFVAKSVPDSARARINAIVPAFAAPLVTNSFAILFPRGCTIRTMQIVGTFIILNSTINFFDHYESKKLKTAVQAYLENNRHIFVQKIPGDSDDDDDDIPPPDY